MSIELPAHLSYSNLSSYMTCGWRHYLERGLNIQGPPNWAQIGGAAVHDMTADYDTGKPVTREDFAAYFQTALEKQLHFAQCEESDIRATGRASREYPDKKDKRWWLEQGPGIFDKWVSWMAMSPWEVLDLPDEKDLYHVGDGAGPPAVEFDVSGYIGDIYVKAFVDRAFVLPSGEVAVVDIKTGMKPADALQLGTYATLMEKTLGVRPTYGYYWMADSGGTAEPVHLDRYTEDYLVYLYSTELRALKAGIYLPHVTNMCSGCGVREFCPGVGGSKAHEIPLPQPLVEG